MEIGTLHSVTCVRFRDRDVAGAFATLWWPTIGPRHEDKKYINFAPEHYHVDHRFCTDAQIRRLKGAFPIHSLESVRITSKVMCVEGKEHEVKVRRIRCRRKQIYFPQCTITEKLKAGFQDCALKNAGVCPHKGFPMEPLAEDERFAVCPGHGLVWNLVERRVATEEEEQRINALIGRDDARPKGQVGGR